MRVGVGETRGRYYERRDNCSQSSSWKDIECFYCHEKGHIRRNCEELTRHLEENSKQKAQETEFANVIGDRYDVKMMFILLLLKKVIMTLGFWIQDVRSTCVHIKCGLILMSPVMPVLF